MARFIPLEEQFASKDVKEIYKVLKRRYGGEVPNLQRILAYKPRILDTYARFLNEILSPSTLEARLKELAVLTALLKAKCGYEIVYHIIPAKSMKLTPAEIRYVEGKTRKKIDLTEQDTLTIAFASEIVRNKGTVKESLFKKMRRAFTREEIIELTVIITAAVFVSYIVNVLKMES